MIKHTIVAVATLALLAGCSGMPSNTGEVAEEESTAPAKKSAPAEPAETTEAAGSLTKPFGSSFEWDSGEKVTITAPKPAKLSDYVAKDSVGKGQEAVEMQVTVANGTKEPLNPMMVNIQATSGDADAEKVFDSAAGYDMPTADILPGKSKKWKIAFVRTKGAEFVVQVNANFQGAGYYTEK